MIHHKAIENMHVRLKKALENCYVENRRPVFSSYTSNVSDFAKETTKHTGDWLTVFNIYTIFLKNINVALLKWFPENNEVAGLLKDLLDKKALADLGEAIIRYIVSIPRTYSIYFPMPTIAVHDKNAIILSDNISMNHYLKKDEIPSGFNGGLSMGLSSYKGFNFDTSYVCITETGYAGGYLEDSAFIEGLSKLKQLIFLCLLQGLLRIKPASRYATGLVGSHLYPNRYAVVFDNENPDVKDCLTDIPESIARYIDKIELNTSSKHYIDAKDRGENAICDYVKDILKTPVKLINTTLDKNALRIKTAIEWAFEATISDNETVAFLQTCIGFEAILGADSDKESLTETLADRCAYLIGTNIETRKRIKNDFRELYRLRSKLVHGREVRLHDKETYYLDWGRKILDSVIAKEMKNLNL